MTKHEKYLAILGVSATIVAVGYSLHLKDKNGKIFQSKPKDTLILGVFIGTAYTAGIYFLMKHN